MGRNLSDIANGIKGAQTDTDWLREPYVGGIIVKSVKYSEDTQGYTGTPFFKFFIETLGLEDNKKTEITFWRPKKGEDPEKSNNKLSKLKKFYDNCGVDASLEGEEYIEAVVGKKCNVVIQMQERLLEKAKPPKITNNPNYWYSVPIDENIEITQDKLFVRLSEAEMKKFSMISDQYNKSNPEEEQSKSVQANTNFESEKEEDF